MVFLLIIACGEFAYIRLCTVWIIILIVCGSNHLSDFTQMVMLFYNTVRIPQWNVIYLLHSMQK